MVVLTVFVTADCYHIRGGKFGNIVARWSSCNEPTSTSPHDTGVTMECWPSHTAVWLAVYHYSLPGF